MLLHQRIESQAVLTPNAVAVRCDDNELTYAELDQRANQCARYLRELGVGPDVIVGVAMARALELMVALLGILKAGGAYLPMDPDYPASRLDFLLEDADVAVVVTQPDFADTFARFDGTVLLLDRESELLSVYECSSLESLNQPQDLAYVIYTSGSTGQPKGCMLTHEAICNRLDWMQQMYRLTADDRVLQKTPYTFDVSVWELFWPLREGAVLVFAKPQGHKDSHYLVTTIREEAITICHFVPSMLRFFLNDPLVPQCASLRDVFVSGEALPFEFVARFKTLLSARLHNLYGPTEAAVDVSYWACEIRPDKRVPIGRAIGNIRLYVLDEARQPVARGQEGELHIAGIGLARGYLNRPELTAERFVPDPFGEPGSRMYRTGDRVRELADGNIEFLGRMDFQVKLRGLRIELGEIESTLRDFPAVGDAVVLVRDEEEGDPKLVAYLESGQPVAPRAVRDFVRERLPEYMVPNIVTVLERLPVNTHGKLDRKALPWPLTNELPVSEGDGGAVAAVRPAAADDVRRRITGFLTELLKNDSIDEEADLFDLGATSLTLVSLAEKISQAYGIDVPVDVFLGNPTLAAIVAHVQESGIGAGADAEPEPEPAVRPGTETDRQPHAASQQNGVLAIVGLSGRYPGADTLDGYWENLHNGVSSIAPMPPERLAMIARAGAKEVPVGGYLDRIDRFDSLLFGISPVEARTMDPQERLLLESAWACLEDAGYTAESLLQHSPRAGVFIGVMWNDYQSHGVQAWESHGQVAELSYHASLANRLSFFFNFTGPSVAINTSCSAGMTALHFACESLRHGDCDVALVGGVNLMAHAYHAHQMAAGNILAKEDVCRPFSAKASGWILGEGVGTVLIKRQEDALRDRDHLYALIRGSAIGHTGRTARFTMPNAQQQEKVIRQTLSNAGLLPDDIDYVEAAAPGASMADAAEMSAVKAVFGASERQRPCYVGTVKANLGHLESASVFSQLTKVLYQLRHCRLAPSLNSQPRNPLITLTGTKLSIVEQPSAWPMANDRPRYALINALGAAGSEGHLILQECSAAMPEAADDRPTVVALSAATEEQLKQQGRQLLDFLQRYPDTRLADLAFTLRSGRVPMAERWACVAMDIEGLRAALAACSSGDDAQPDTWRGRGGTIAETVAASADPRLLAQAWAGGGQVDWSLLPLPGARRISLPTYPFEQVRHWLDQSAATAAHTRSDDDQRCLPAALQEKASAQLRQWFAEVTEIPLERLDADTSWEHYGLSSLMIQTLNGKLEQAFGSVSKTLFFEVGTIRQLTDYLIEHHYPAACRLFGVEPDGSTIVPVASASAVQRSVPGTDRSEQKIAIIGLAGRYPQAGDLEAFWQNLRDGVDAVTEIPPARWQADRYYDGPQAAPGKTSSKWGGFLDGIYEFDPLFFNIAPLQAEGMDPQERLVLQTAWQTFEDAGYTRAAIERLYAGRVGVFIGVSYGEYQLFPCMPNGFGLTGNYATIANRISYVMNLCGPSMAVDTLCSSSLTALHLACESIRRGECEMAIAGGVNLSLHPSKYATHALLNMHSSDGRCRSFGAGGDGFIPSEGVGTVLLKPLEQAVADGDHLYGVVRATVVNHGGRTSGYTVPNPLAQAQMIGQALARAAIDPRTISYIEAHGTGTALGDPIEITGLSKAFAPYTQDRQFCAIGSVKSNIGHCESAAGIAGLTKILLQMQHGQLVPNLHSQQLNPNIDFARTPFVVQQTLAPWQRPRLEREGRIVEYPRIAGISSFGAGGANAHAIIEEYRLPQPVDEYRRPADRPLAILLSAKNPARLQEYVERLATAIECGVVTAANLDRAAYTLQVGRDAMETRLALRVSSLEELREKLRQLQRGETAPDGVYRGEIKRHADELTAFLARENAEQTLDAWLFEGAYDHLLALWVKGLTVDWNRLYGDNRPQRIGLPTYPFARQRYWVSGPSPTALTESVLHPLLHRNTSTLSEQRFSSVFTGDEAVFIEHAAQGAKILPVSAQLEMVRAAIVLALGRESTDDRQIRLQRVVFEQPVAVAAGGVELHLALDAEEDDTILFELYGEEDDGAFVYSHGSASILPLERCEAVVETALPEKKHRDAPSSYALLERVGLQYGSLYRTLTSLETGWDMQGRSLAQGRLALPEASGNGQSAFILHPGLVEGALQAAGFVLGVTEGRPLLPSTMEEVRIFGAIPADAWVIVSRRDAAPEEGIVDMDITDGDGRVAVRIAGLRMRMFAAPVVVPEPADSGDWMLTPVWEPQVAVPATVWPADDQGVVILAENADALYGLGERYPAAEVVSLSAADSIEAIADKLRNGKTLNHVFWLVSPSSCSALQNEDIVLQQGSGVLLGFRIVKALLSLGCHQAALGLTVVTTQSQAIAPSQPVFPAHASVHGLIGSLAKEYPNWRVRLLDMPEEGPLPLEQMLALPADAKGDASLYRHGQWYRQSLLRCAVPKPEQPVYRQHGLYVILGGAGGLGEAYSEYLVRTYQAQLVWIGRRAEDAEIAAKLDRIAALGVRPCYLRADAADFTAMRAAYDEIKRRFGVVHGVVHAMLVLADQSLARMEEERFVSALAPKIDGSVNLVRLFAEDELDFMLFFSSLQSVFKAPGQSNYAAGSTFVDTYAQAVRQACPWPVKVVDWGYWGSIGVVAADAYRQRMGQLGIDSIEPPEAMELLERLLAASLDQLAFLKLQPRQAVPWVQEIVRQNETLQVLPSSSHPFVTLPDKVSQPLPAAAVSADEAQASDSCTAGELYVQLAGLGGLDEAPITLDGLQQRWRMPVLYRDWLSRSLDVLAEYGFLLKSPDGWRPSNVGVADAETLHHAWERHKAKFLQTAELEAHVRLADAALQGLPAILRGETDAPAILFPNSSLALVEAIYKKNPVADYFNEALVEALLAEVEGRLRQEPTAKLRLFEIGAGTGGTSELLFKRLAPYAEQIETYVYSDISKAFLLHAEAQYRSLAPYLRTTLFNVEESPCAQGIVPAAYDIVIAANVLHATADMRQTLRNTKALLKENGLLLANELSSFSLFAHLTFGLLEGWWLATDPVLRIPGCPALSPQSWRFLLETEGYRMVQFPAAEAQPLGQQIIAARSDGLVRRSDESSTGIGTAKEAERRRDDVFSPPSPVYASATAPSGGQTLALKSRVQEALTSIVSAQLKLNREDFDHHTTLNELGFDSITLTGFVNAINERYGLNLTPTVLFEHSTLDRLSRYLTDSHRDALLPHFDGDGQPATPAAAAAPSSAVDSTALAERLQTALAEMISSRLKIRLDEIDGDTTLNELGFDSITLTGFVNAINERYGLDLTPTVLFEHSTPIRLSRYLIDCHNAAIQVVFGTAVSVPAPVSKDTAIRPASVLKRRRQRRPEQVMATAAASRSAPEPIAIIGMSGRFPQAADVSALWTNLADGRNCISEIPASRWDWSTLHSESAEEDFAIVKLAGQIEGFDEFDPRFFNIPPREAEAMDPNQRLLLMYAWKAIEDAGYAPHRLAGSKTALLAAIASSGYSELLARSGRPIDGNSLPGITASGGPNRMSYLLDLHGPSEPVETACSSALVAIHRAVRLLQSGECELALAGGVNLLVSPAAHISFGRAGMLSPDGRCKTFSAQANGYVRGEGVAMLLLKPLSAAKRDGDHVYALIRGSAENHGGKTNSFTAPNPRAQADVIKAAIEWSGVAANSIGYIEAHGTGTPLGDPVEVQGLKTAFEELAAAQGEALPSAYCGLGSIKTNVGHLELAAGVAGLIKIVLQMQHKTLAPSLHCDTLNPYIDLEHSPFYVVRGVREWPLLQDAQGQPLPRRAGVSSFGSGGVNAHVVLEEYVAPTEVHHRAGAERPALIVLSAKNDERLREQVAQLLAAVECGRITEDNLLAAAYTLQVGREAMEERLAFTAVSLAELREKLTACRDEQTDIDTLYRGQIRQAKQVLSAFNADEDLIDTIRAWFAKGKYRKLLELWSQGLNIDWNALYGDSKPQRLSLPSYPFARERYWVSADNQAVRAALPETGGDLAVLHPLVHRNTSDFDELRFTTRLTGEEPWLADHVVQGRRILPGAAHLEMAQAALRLMLGTEDGVIRLDDIVWIRPLEIVDEALEVQIALLPQKDATVAFDIYTGEDVLHSQGRLCLLADEAVPRLALDTLQARCRRDSLAGATCYARFDALGMRYGPAHRVIERIGIGAGEVLTRLVSAQERPTDVEQFVLHPGLLDGAFQSLIGFAGAQERNGLLLPFAVDQIDIFGRCHSHMWAYTRISDGVQPQDAVQKFDIDLCDDEGGVIARIRGYSTRSIEGLPHEEYADGVLLLQPYWRERAATVAVASAAPSHILLCGVGVTAPALADRLTAVSCIDVAMGSDLADSYAQAVRQLCRLIQAILQDKPSGPVLIQIVVPGGGTGQLLTGLAGFLDTARQENPKLMGQVIEVDDAEDARSLAAKLIENAGCPHERRIRYRQGRRELLDWQEIDMDAMPQVAWKAGGVYLITGGLGGLGRVFARRIAGQAAGVRLVLSGRRELDEDGRIFLRELEAAGAVVQYRQLDVTDRAAVERLLLEIQEEHEALNGILHSAGVLRDSLLINKTDEDILSVLAPKVTGLINLDESSRQIELDCFVCFSSTAAVFGNAGQADYAAANGFMDAYARYRRQRVAEQQGYGCTLSVNWPLWAEGGMRLSAADEQAMAVRTGLKAMDSDSGVQALSQLLARTSPQAMVLAGSKARIRHWLASLDAPVSRPLQDQPATGRSDGVDTQELSVRLQAALADMIMSQLGVGAEEVTGNTTLSEIGFDSISLTAFANTLNKRYGLDLTPTLLFEHSTLERLTRYLVTHRLSTLQPHFTSVPVGAVAEPPSPIPPPAVPVSRRRRQRRMDAVTVPVMTKKASEPVAIIGVSGCFPQSADLNALWANLLAGRDCITEIPKSRWDWDALSKELNGGKPIECRHAGLIDGYDTFDPLFFNISPRETLSMDPNHRLVMMHVWKAIEDAGYAAHHLAGSRTALLVGINNSGYAGLWNWSEKALEGNSLTGISPPGGPNRMSYLLDLHGPSEPVDTVCSSSLVAIHRAVQLLQSGECELALAGGVNTLVSPALHVSLANAGILSPEGRCKAFSDSADGYVRGEGVGMLLLKPLSAAERDGDHIYALIRGSAENHGGKANSPTSPNPRAQADLIKNAIKTAGIDPATIGYIEAHGTGTALGDPIEVQGLLTAFQELADERGEKLPAAYCGLGSVKSNVGHLELAAGMSGIAKILLQMQHRTLVPSLYCETLNPYIELKESPFYVVTGARDWTPLNDADGCPLPRRAGISSFGIGGVNVHIVLEEYIDSAAHVSSRVSAEQPALILLSAKNADRLREQAGQLCDAVGSGWITDANLADAAYTLQVGREAMEDRLALVIASAAELAEKLKHHLTGQNDIQGLYRAQIKQTRQRVSDFDTDEDLADTVRTWLAKGKYGKLLEWWVQGLSIDWDQLYGEHKPRRMSLPTYPFAKDRYWPDETGSGGQTASFASAEQAVGVLHPLLQRNTSDLDEQRFSTRFDGQEFFLNDHRVQGQRVLPGVAYLEMAGQSLLQGAGFSETDGIRLQNVVWLRPLTVGEEEVQVHTALYRQEDGTIGFEIYSGEDVLHSQGSAQAISIDTPSRLDVAALQAQCPQNMAAADCYALFEAAGLHYGPAHRAIEQLHIGAQQVLSRLVLPTALEGDAERYRLHPSLLDGALQSLIGLTMQEGPGSAAMPFAVERVDILGRCSSRMWASARRSEGVQPGDAVQKFDIDLCTDDGVLAVSMRGFSTRRIDAVAFAGSEDTPVSSLLAAAWEVEQPVLSAHEADQPLLVIGGSVQQHKQLRQCFAQVRIADFGPDDDIAGISEALAQHDSIDHLVWILPSTDPAVSDERMIDGQREGALFGFRLTKALLAAGYGSKVLQWTVLTTQTQAVLADEEVVPLHAAVHGLMGSLAKEYPRWAVRLVDLPRQEKDWPLDEALALPPDPQGNSLAWRHGQWYRQRLLAAEVAVENADVYRRGGCYVVIGGAGGIGEVLSEHLIRQHDAQVVWIGRRSADAAIREKIERLGRLGHPPYYLAADACDREALQQARNEIRQRFGAIHGLVHSALVLRDRSLANMDEETFAASLSAKVDVSVRLAQVFGADELDFVLFFSSLQSFSRAPGQSNYAAGCTFKDAFGLRLGSEWRCPVKVMNWGWWGSVGSVASDAYRERMAQQGLASIEADEGMAAVKVLLGSSAGQLALVKLTAEAARRQPVDDKLEILARSYPSLITAIDRPARTFAGQGPDQAFDRMLGKLLCAQLQQLGLQGQQQGSAAEIGSLLGLGDQYGQWFEHTLRVLDEQGYVHYDGQQLSTENMPVLDSEAVWSEWDSIKAAASQEASAGAQLVLVETTLKALPEVLSGKRQATDVMFPDSSMHLVEGIYKHNPVADYFNEVLADAVEAFVQERLRQEEGASLRILEIGAGTGGTSQLLFERLRPYAAHIDEYCYTDLSKAFLFHAEKEYGPGNPYLRCQLLDVSQPLVGQGIALGQYDLVIAANVLHATANIRRSVRHAKQALKAHGLLLLNEISRNQLFAHLTFGLLEGWWLYEDASLRIAGCPALSADSWQRVLQDEGFRRTLVKGDDSLGQQIVIGESDGRVRTPSEAVEQVATQPAQVVQAVRAPEESIAPPPAVERSAAVAGQVEDVHEKATAYFKRLLGETLQLSPQQISATEPMEAYGIDSILVVGMTTTLQKVFDNVSSTLFFEHRTIDALVKHFMETQPEALAKVLNLSAADDGHQTERSHGESPVVATQVQPVPGRRHSRRSRGVAPQSSPAGIGRGAQDIAIIGLSGRYPQAKDLQAFWENLREGRDCISEIPPDRWDHERYYDPQRGLLGKSYSKWGGFIEGVAEFDPLFFNIAPREAEGMDPQERLMLMQAYAGIEDAGYTPGSLSLSGKVGVFVGVMNSYYHGSPRYWSIANRVSYLFDFQGPSLAVDTACSSSLSALHLALENLRNGVCDAAIVGGVNVIIDPLHYVGLSAMSMLSERDHCRPFGVGADGFIDGEGVGAVVLKPLAQAQADGDHIYGVIKGSALNHGGKTNGYTVPNPVAQAGVIRQTLEQSGIHPRSISYVEAHGTGTNLGDPIEISGLSKAFGERTDDKQYCAIGSVKSNIGHSESAAGLAGLTKVLLQMQHGQLVPSLHARELNPHIDFAGTPFAVQQRLDDWKRPQVQIEGKVTEYPRRAGISSFGAGGSNAHVIIEEYVAPEREVVRRTSAQNPVLIVLSAKTEERLRECVDQVRESIEQGRITDENLADAAYTLQVGREAMEERLAMVVDSIAALEEKLQQILQGEDAIEGVFRGQVKRNREAMELFVADEDLQEAISKWVQRKKFAKILKLWVKGLGFDWYRLYDQERPRRMSLPTYPFARDRYWSESSGFRLRHEEAPSGAAIRIERNFNEAFFAELLEAVDNDSLTTEDAVAKYMEMREGAEQ